MDIVGYCESCDRWFTCVTDQLDQFVCAWCGQEPIRLKGRDTTAHTHDIAASTHARS